MTPNQLASLDYAISQLFQVKDVDPHHLSVLRSLYTSVKEEHRLDALRQKHYASQKDIPPMADHRIVPAALLVFMARHGITIPHKELSSWRMVPLKEQRPGAINALPESRGILRATNGILCYVECPNNMLYLGHLQWWKADEEPATLKGSKRPPSMDAKPKPLSRRDALLALVEEMDI